MTREQIEKIATDCGVEVSYTEQGKGGFIIDSSKEKHESVTDVVINFFNDDKSEILRWFGRRVLYGKEWLQFRLWKSNS